MSETIFAGFTDRKAGEDAVKALLDGGIAASQIAMLVHEEERKDVKPSVTPKEGEDGGLNPAQMDYPIREDLGETAFSSRPPAAKSDFNKDLDKRDYNDSYGRGAEEDFKSDKPYKDVKQENLPSTVAANADLAPQAQVAPAPKVLGPAPVAGIGVGIGALAAVLSITVPGVGFLIGGGALAAAVAGLAAATGYSHSKTYHHLVEAGLDPKDLREFEAILLNGGAAISVVGSEGEVSKAKAVLNDHGATAVSLPVQKVTA